MRCIEGGPSGEHGRSGRLDNLCTAYGAASFVSKPRCDAVLMKTVHCRVSTAQAKNLLPDCYFLKAHRTVRHTVAFAVEREEAPYRFFSRKRRLTGQSLFPSSSLCSRSSGMFGCDFDHCRCLCSRHAGGKVGTETAPHGRSNMILAVHSLRVTYSRP